jgi:uncharacterized protein YbbK (DUF523 family)
MIVISSCLIGKKCRYNATDSLNQQLLNSINEEYIDICPELLGGLSAPRLPCEIVHGEGKDVLAGTAKIVDCAGNDIAYKMLHGVNKALDICKAAKVTKAYLKRNSTTCGCGEIYDENFSSTMKNGNGIFAELLLSNGIEIIGI